MKYGRNEPCPCGSGRKYKRCCLRAPAGGPARDAPSSAARPESMSIEAIEAQLRAYGVRDSHEEFLALCEGRDSACAIADHWEDVYTVREEGQDYLRYAACELWQRLLPTRPCIEMIDGWMQTGYDLVDAGDHADACRTWWIVWRELRDRFGTGRTTMGAMDDVFDGVQSVFNWTDDFELAFVNAAAADPVYAKLGERYCEEWLEQFPDERAAIRRAFENSLAEFRRLGEAGERDPAGGRQPVKARSSAESADCVNIDYRAEVDYIVDRAAQNDARIVRFEPLVLFSTDTGDAWMLDIDDNFALPLARNGEKLPVRILESSRTALIEWTHDYAIDGERFEVVERGTGSERVIVGYPTSEIARR